MEKLMEFYVERETVPPRDEYTEEWEGDFWDGYEPGDDAWVILQDGDDDDHVTYLAVFDNQKDAEENAKERRKQAVFEYAAKIVCDKFADQARSILDGLYRSVLSQAALKNDPELWLSFDNFAAMSIWGLKDSYPEDEFVEEHREEFEEEKRGSKDEPQVSDPEESDLEETASPEITPVRYLSKQAREKSDPAVERLVKLFLVYQASGTFNTRKTLNIWHDTFCRLLKTQPNLEAVLKYNTTRGYWAEDGKLRQSDPMKFLEEKLHFLVRDYNRYMDKMRRHIKQPEKELWNVETILSLNAAGYKTELQEYFTANREQYERLPNWGEVKAWLEECEIQ
jgi:hypothetical protein